MKKIAGKISFAFLLLCLPYMVFGNSGPVYWQGYPSAEILSIEGDTPIAVKKENLIFDFSGQGNNNYTISGKVTAAYDMVNPTNEAKSVQMAFPFVGSFKDFSRNDIVITAGGSVLPYDIYIGDVVDSHGDPRVKEKEASFDFAGIVSTITNELYNGSNFANDEKGKLYTIEVAPEANQRINIAIDFNFDFRKTKVFTNGFNSYEGDGEKIRIASWCDKPEVLEIFVLGEEINLEINAFTDGELSKKTDLYSYQVSEQEAEVKSYLMKFVKNNTRVNNDSGISETQLYNLYAGALDRYLTRNMGYSSEHDLMAQEYYERIFTLVYTVEFPPDSEKGVSVSYKASGTMDKRETAKPLYTFDYILNPAENWSDFKNLNVQIIPPKEAPYIVKSSIEFKKGENGSYTAAMEDLPERDLSFTLYENKKITLLDKVAGSLHKRFGYLYPLVIGIIALVAAPIIITVAIKLLRRRNI
ncbi:MAG TPA: hypothetical protein PLW11_07435 [Bacillota bacterium]|nr:hypothetical protein [Bacillota bacterium]